MVYPSTVLVVAIGVVVLMLGRVIPTFEKMFEDFGGELPGQTQVGWSLSHFMQQWIGPTDRRIVGDRVGCFFAARRRSPEVPQSPTRSRSSCRSSGRCCARCGRTLHAHARHDDRRRAFRSSTASNRRPDRGAT
jgi:hypothetical protein